MPIDLVIAIPHPKAPGRDRINLLVIVIQEKKRPGSDITPGDIFRKAYGEGLDRRGHGDSAHGNHCPLEVG